MLAVVLTLSFIHITPFEGVPEFSWTDKVAHLILYYLFTLIIMFDYAKSTRNKTEKKMFLLLCIAFPVFIGGITEILQSLFFAPREGDWLDFVFNVYGVLLAWLTFRFWQVIKKT